MLRFFCILIALVLSCAEQCPRRRSKLKTLHSKNISSNLSEGKHLLIDSCDSNPVNSIFDFFDEQLDFLEFAKYRQLVFVFGAEKSDKTMLTLFITNAELEAVETSPNSREIVFIDKDGPFNEYPSYINPKLIPDLIPNKNRGFEFYTMPEYNITADVKYDITRTHILQRLLKYAVGVKFLFVISYASVEHTEPDTADEREEIKELVRNATNLIKDIEKYKNSMALVVTNYNSTGSDEFDVVNIAGVLEKISIEYDAEIDNPDITEAEREEIRRNRKLINIFQTTTHDGSSTSIHPKIGIFRVANQTGLVDDIEYLDTEKVHIRSIIEENIQYVQKEDDDFHFNIRDESRVYIPNLIKLTEEQLLLDISDISSELEDIHVQFERKNYDLAILYEKMETGYNVLSKIDSPDPRTFVKQVLEAAEMLQIEVSIENIKTILKHIEFIDFLEELQNISPKNTFKLKNGIQDINTFLIESMEWYSWLIEMHDILSQYNIQKDVIEYEIAVSAVIEMTATGENEKRSVADIGLMDLLDLVNISLPHEIESMTINFYKLRSLENVLQRTMLDQATPYCSPGRIEVKGYNVKISSFNEMECEGNITSIEIFAMNNLFIDADIEKVVDNIQLFIIAPTWEVIGERQIILNGTNGEPNIPRTAKEGSERDPKGKPGLPGKPGGPAGCFSGIGNNFINDEKLKVLLNGGTGGIGQHGGDGTYILCGIIQLNFKI